ncbi:hypothetical protein H8D36_06790 [archaeon]|nr:hypothetical protein [archaeon]
MVIGIIIAIVVLVFLGILLMNLKHHSKSLKIVTVVVVLLLLYFSIAHVFNVRNVDLSSPKEIIGGLYYYVGWVGNSLGQIFDSGKSGAIAVGNVIKINQTKN